MKFLPSPQFIAMIEYSADQLERLNDEYPHLASDFTRLSVEDSKKALGSVEFEPQAEPERDEAREKLAEQARELVAHHNLEDAMDTLAQEQGVTLNLVQFIDLIGKSAYIQTLKREAGEFRANAISFEQMAQLWNDFGRPPLGDEAWTATSVSLLMEG